MIASRAQLMEFYCVLDGLDDSSCILNVFFSLQIYNIFIALY